MRPRELFTRKTPKIAQTPSPPTVQDLLGGDREPPLTAEQHAGVHALAVLARREVEATEAAVEAQRKARAEAEEALRDGIWERYLQRQREALS
jgi:hypothetical protein